MKPAGKKRKNLELRKKIPIFAEKENKRKTKMKKLIFTLVLTIVSIASYGQDKCVRYYCSYFEKGFGVWSVPYSYKYERGKAYYYSKCYEEAVEFLSSEKASVIIEGGRNIEIVDYYNEYWRIAGAHRKIADEFENAVRYIEDYCEYNKVTRDVSRYKTVAGYHREMEAEYNAKIREISRAREREKAEAFKNKEKQLFGE